MADPSYNVQSWIEYKAPEYDPAWAWKKSMEMYTAPPASERLEQQKSKFRGFMNSFQGKYKDRDGKSFRFDSTMTWTEVQTEATGAFDEYARQGRSWRHPFRSSGRLFGTVACRIEFLIQLLPQGDYLGLLCGGLTLVYNAARRMKEVRELIIRTLDSLSEHIEGSKSYIRIYAWNEDLRWKTEDLYIAILEAVEGITEWIQHSSLGEAFKSVFKQSDYGKELEEKLSTNIQDKATAFGDCVTQCLHLMVQAIHQNVLTVGQKVEQVGVDVSQGLSSLGQKAEKFTFDATRSLEEQLHGIARDVEWQFNRLQQRQDQFMEEMRDQAQSTNNFQMTSIYMPQAIQPAINVQQLLSLLDLQPNDQPDDVVEQISERVRADRDFIVFFGRSLSHHRLSRISFVMQNHLFQDWFKSMKSQTLVVYGMDTSFDVLETVSPVSFMCAILSQTVSRRDYTYPLNVFCRLHMDLVDPMQGANGLLRSLTAQVILAIINVQQQQLDLSFLGPTEVEAIRAKDLGWLCLLFEKLLQHIGVGIVFCIIDAVSCFESEPYVAEMHTVMQFLNSLVEAVEASQSGLVFKLMVTSPIVSQYCRDWFPNRVELYAPGAGLIEGQEVNNLGLFTDSQSGSSGEMAFASF